MVKKNFIRRTGKGLIFIFLMGMFLFPCLANADYFSDDFESGLGKWIVSGQDWDLTECSYISPTHSLTDSPSENCDVPENYAPNTNASATLAASIDLSTSTSPVLTFWHKIDVLDWLPHDCAYVEISTDGGTTYPTVLRSWCNVKSTTWALEQIDLSNYKTSQVKIRFRLVSDEDVRDGWYIDDVEIKEKDSIATLNVFISPEDGGTVTGEGIDCPGDCSETYPCKWIVSGQDWDLTESTSRSATHSLTDSPSGDYAPYTNASATLAAPIDLSTSTSPVLTFWHKIDVLDWLPHDCAYVEISTDGGTTYPTVLRSWCNVKSTTWALEQIDLSNYKTSQVKIRFRLVSDEDVRDGWYIDDVEIKELSGSISYFFDNFEGENSLSNWIVKKCGIDLTAIPNPGFAFNSWNGCDTSAGNICIVKLDVINRIVTASFIDSSVSPPIIDEITFDSCISALCTSGIHVTAHDPEGGELTYIYEPYCGGAVIGSGASVEFDPLSISSWYPCPHHVLVTVTSSVSGLSTSEIVDIFVKIAGDINGDGMVNPTDKLLLRNQLGWSGIPGSIPEDLNCDGYINATDKLWLRKTLGQTGCVCP
jgi:uncharacterized cysteine cluster protein YcgN (CxxCxxCC family)